MSFSQMFSSTASLPVDVAGPQRPLHRRAGGPGGLLASPLQVLALRGDLLPDPGDDTRALGPLQKPLFPFVTRATIVVLG